MADANVDHPLRSTLQKQAIDDAVAAFSTLPQEDLILKKCIAGKERLFDVVQSLLQHKSSHEKKKSTVILERFQRHTMWIQGMGEVIDVAVQTQAGIACSVWAPIKFVLKVSKDISKTTELIIDMIESVSECLPRLEIYEKLSRSDQMLQASLLRVFTDIISFSVKAFQFYHQRSFVRLVRSCSRNFDEELKSTIVRLERHARVADQTALTKELLEAAEFRAELRHKDDRELWHQCERRLRPANIDEIHQNRISTRLDNTCTWILDYEKYKHWCGYTPLVGLGRVLQIMGTPGCGKSILASFIVASLIQDQKITLYCPFLNTIPYCRTSDNFVRNALWQLLKSNIDSQLKQDLCRQVSQTEPSITELWQILAKLVKSSTVDVYLVLDGLDECADFEKALLPKLLSLMLDCGNLKLLCLGRPYAVEALTLPTNWVLQRIEITVDLVGKDVLAFTQNEVAKLAIIQEPDLRARIVCALIEKADTMFLWVQLMITDLQKSVSISDVKRKLTSLPRGLEEAFQTILLRILEGSNASEIRLAQTVLTILSIVSRSLTFDELNHAQAVNLWADGQQKRCSVKEHLLIQPIHRIAEICGGLLIVREGLANFIHASVRDFLCRPLDKWVTRSDVSLKSFRVDELSAHRFVAELGMNAIELVGKQISQPISLLEDNKSLLAIKQEYPFALYAYEYTFHHLNRSTERADLDVRVTQLLSSKHANLWVEIFVEALAENPSLDLEIEEFEKWVSAAEIDIGSTQLFDLSYWLRTVTVLQLPEPPEEDNSCSDIVRRSEENCRSTNDSGYEEDNYSHGDDLPGENSGSEKVQTESSRDTPILTSVHAVSNKANEHSDSASAAEARDWPALEPTRRSHNISDSVRAVSRATDLLKTANFPSSSSQMQIFAMLARAVRYTRKIIDPLEALFNLILSRAGSLSVYVLMGVAEFYILFDKFEHARKIIDAALTKVKDQETLTKYIVYSCLTQCCALLEQVDLAYESATIAEKGFRDILGQAHWVTCIAGFMKSSLARDTEAMKEAVECLRRLQKFGNIKPFGIEVYEWWAWMTCDLARWLRELQQIDQAESELQQVYSNLKFAHDSRMEAIFELGMCDYERRLYEKARTAFQRVCDHKIKQQKKDGTDWVYAEATNYVAHCSFNLGDYEAATKYYLKLRKLSLRWTSGESEHSLDALVGIGDCEYRFERYEEAKATYQKVCGFDLKKIGVRTHFSRDVWLKIGHCDYSLAKYEEAKIFYEKVVAHYSTTNDEQDVACTRVRKYIADCEYRLGRYEEAKLSYEKVTSYDSTANDEHNVKCVDTRFNIAKCKFNLGRYKDARVSYKRVISSYSITNDE